MIHQNVAEKKPVVHKGQDANQENPPSEGFVKFQKSMEGHSKDVSRILSCHLLAEYFLDKIILIKFQRGDLITERDNSPFMFMEKWWIVKALDVLEDSILTSIRALNKVRNNCSHQMEYQITETDVDMIGKPLGVDYLKNKKKIRDLSDLLEHTLLIVMARMEGNTDRILDKAPE